MSSRFALLLLPLHPFTVSLSLQSNHNFIHHSWLSLASAASLALFSLSCSRARALELFYHHYLSTRWLEKALETLTTELNFHSSLYSGCHPSRALIVIKTLSMFTLSKRGRLIRICWKSSWVSTLFSDLVACKYIIFSRKSSQFAILLILLWVVNLFFATEN